MLYCVLIESPEVLNIIQENHIKSIISLLDKHGRNHKVGFLSLSDEDRTFLCRKALFAGGDGEYLAYKNNVCYLICSCSQ